MRIALISEHASPLAVAGGVDSGGQNIYVMHVARHLARLGHAVDVFTRRDKALLPTIHRMGHGVRVIHVDAGPALTLPKEALLPYMDGFGDFLSEFARAQPLPYDVMHANFFMSGAAALKARARLGVPLVMTFHALGRVRRLHQGTADGFPDERFEIEDRLVREADTIVAECPQDRDDLLSLYGARAERIVVAPCGFDADEFHPVPMAAARATLGWPENEFSVLQLGRLVPRKGIDNVVRGIAALRHEHGVRARLYIVGGNADAPNEIATPEIARLRHIAEQTGVGDQVVFAGRRGRDELRQFYSAADVFVTTPWYEPFGITPIEAMACGTPVIGSRVGGVKSTVDDGVTGFLVPPDEPRALAGRLRLLHEQPRLRRTLGEAGRARAHALYTWSGVTQQLLEVYARHTRARLPARSSVGLAGLPPLAADGEPGGLSQACG